MPTRTKREMLGDLQEFVNCTAEVLRNWSEGDLAHAVNCLEEHSNSVQESYGIEPESEDEDDHDHNDDCRSNGCPSGEGRR